jgi:hypothetical protein
MLFSATVFIFPAVRRNHDEMNEYLFRMSELSDEDHASDGVEETKHE